MHLPYILSKNLSVLLFDYNTIGFIKITCIYQKQKKSVSIFNFKELLIRFYFCYDYLSVIIINY